jgi:hypothetical protein
VNAALDLTLLLSGALCIWGVIAWRRTYLLEVPLTFGGRALPTAEAAARVVGEETSLVPARGADGLGWVAALLLAPIWFIWGDLRTRRSERHLARWRLLGARGDRPAQIALHPDVETVAVACARSAFAADLERPLDEQEGLRALHPMGGERWQRGLQHVASLQALGFVRLRGDDGLLLGKRAFDATRATASYARALDELAALAALLESI